MNTRYTKSLLGLSLLASAMLSQAGFAQSTMSSGTMSGKPKMSGSTMSGGTMMSNSKMSGTSSAMARTQMTGTVTKVRGMMMMVKPSTGSRMAKTVMVPSNAKIMMGSKMGKMSGLKVGQKVRVFMTGSKITRIDVMSGMVRGVKMSGKSGSMMSGSTMSGSTMSGGTMSGKPKM